MPHINVVWSAPFQIFLALYFLYQLVGVRAPPSCHPPLEVSALAGLAVLMVLVPANMVGEAAAGGWRPGRWHSRIRGFY